MILVLGCVVSKVGNTAEALALSQDHVVRSRAEKGCLSHAVHQDTENPQRLVFVEQWSSSASLWEHFKVPASRAFAKALANLSTEAPSMQLYEATEIALPGKNAA